MNIVAAKMHFTKTIAARKTFHMFRIIPGDVNLNHCYREYYGHT